ncbi:beta-ketoacyl synthase [Bacteriovorax sp. Seq25_V]|uniref:beta-ketoacyl-[acyl-carrier-protein] synthase family protein n=1 Tax=Bacteriovorax sp. Seq25_V TaxID=1201288 RepID=UPI00038A32FB|nr:beta-ketoacyl-[acyl-carrier-protein] synthase family protein [Bacteriovorax sp. Seq25_V]EQC44863.1 beta-ketoacyl synthase, N-terminal domain protein [Bacteriovorax sp. Seq25_V]
MNLSRVVITGVGLTAPNGNNLQEYRKALLEQKSGITEKEVRFMGKIPVGECNFDEEKHQKKKMRRRGTRVGAISVYCSKEALDDAGINLAQTDVSRVGIYLGITEHGPVETEEELFQFYKNNEENTKLWTHHHNPRTVANNPAGEVSLNLGITGPHYTIGAACAAGNMGIIQAVQMLQLGEVDLALAGGVSESSNSFGNHVSFMAQGALADNPTDQSMASKPLDKDRNGIVISEGGAVYTLERLEDAIARGAKIYGEIVGYHSNSDATDFVLPNPTRQLECMKAAIAKAKIEKNEIDIVNLHATGTQMGDIQEMKGIIEMFADSPNTKVNCTKGLIGHSMGAAGALELAGNLPSFSDNLIHPCHKIENLDPECAFDGLVLDKPITREVNYILNSSFGMLGINSVLIVKKYHN